MADAKDQKIQEEREFNSFIKRLRRINGLEVEVLDNKIKKKCGKGIYEGIYQGIKEALLQINEGKFRFVFRENKESESVWPSDARPGWIVINFAHPKDPFVLAKRISEAVEENR